MSLLGDTWPTGQHDSVLASCKYYIYLLLTGSSTENTLASNMLSVHLR